MSTECSRPRATISVRYFGRHTRSCRKARGLTQEDLAERSGLAVDTIRRIESSSFSPSLDTICKLCDGLDVALSTLFESLELGERITPREFADGVYFLTPDEERALYQLVAVVTRDRRS